MKEELTKIRDSNVFEQKISLWDYIFSNDILTGQNKPPSSYEKDGNYNSLISVTEFCRTTNCKEGANIRR